MNVSDENIQAGPTLRYLSQRSAIAAVAPLSKTQSSSLQRLTGTAKS